MTERINGLMARLKTTPIRLVDDHHVAMQVFGPMIFSANATFMQQCLNPHLRMSEPEAIILNPFALSVTPIEERIQIIFHELAHATGTKDRLNRPQDGVNTETVRRPSLAYAFEELIAESTANLLMMHFELHTEHTRDQINQYLQSYASFFPPADQVTMLERAIVKAEEAKDYILNNWLKENP